MAWQIIKGYDLVSPSLPSLDGTYLEFLITKLERRYNGELLLFYTLNLTNPDGIDSGTQRIEGDLTIFERSKEIFRESILTASYDQTKIELCRGSFLQGPGESCVIVVNFKNIMVGGTAIGNMNIFKTLVNAPTYPNLDTVPKVYWNNSTAYIGIDEVFIDYPITTHSYESNDYILENLITKDTYTNSMSYSRYFTPNENYALYMPGTRRDFEFRLKSNGLNYSENFFVSMNLKIEDKIKPQLINAMVDPVNPSNLPNTLFIKGISKLKISTVVNCYRGTDVDYGMYNGGGFSYRFDGTGGTTASTVQTGPRVYYDIVVYDKRGLGSNIFSSHFTVLDYSPPSFRSVETKRALSSGVESDNLLLNKNLFIKFEWSFSSLNENNIIERVEYEIIETGQQDSLDNVSENMWFLIKTDADPYKDYTIKLTIQDRVGNSSESEAKSFSVATVMNINKNKNSISFGGYAPRDPTSDEIGIINMDWKIVANANAEIKIHGLGSSGEPLLPICGCNIKETL